MAFVSVTNRFPGNSAYRTMRCRTIHLLGATLLLTLLSGREVRGQETLDQPRFATRPDAQTERLYRGILDDIGSADYDQAATGISKLRTEHSGVLIPIEARHEIEATLLADVLSSRLPDRIAQEPTPLEWKSFAGHALWRQQLLGRISPEQFLSAGDQFWRAGEITKAKLFWRLSQTAAEPNGGDQASIEVFKRQIVAALFEGRFRQARIKLSRFKNSFPEVIGRVAGEEGNLVEILERLSVTLQEDRKRSLLNSKGASPSEPGRVNFVRRMWSVGVSHRNVHSKTIPLLWNNVVLLHDEDGVRALDLKTGKSAWPVNEQDDGFLFETNVTATQRERASLAVGSGVLNENTWYGRTGVAGFTKNSEIKSVEQSRLIALNLKAEGRLEWTVAAETLRTRAEETSRVFSGHPIIAQGHLFVPMRMPAPLNVYIACLDLVDGSYLWTCNVSANLIITQSGKTEFHDQLVFAEGCLFLSMHGQTVCCVDAESGHLNWISGVERRRNLKQTLNENHHDLLVSEGRVFATTMNGVAAFDLYSGDLLWEQILRSPPKSLLGINDGYLIASSPHLLAMDVQSGRISWQHRVANSHTSRGTLLGRSAVWLTGDEVWTVDSQNGRVLQRDLFSKLTGQQAHDIKLFDSMLIANEGDQLTLYRVDISN